MVKMRDVGWVRIINEPALSRIKHDQCPSCGKPKSDWKRTTRYRCCSVECTGKFESFCIIRSWADLRDKVFNRDGGKCAKCGNECLRYGKWNDLTREYDLPFTADHIIPIALGGDQWDINNIQTLCPKCNRNKTKNDSGMIALARKMEKIHSKNKSLREIIE